MKVKMRTSLIALSCVSANFFGIPFLGGNDPAPTPQVPAVVKDVIPGINDGIYSESYFNRFKKYITESVASVEDNYVKSNTTGDPSLVANLVNDLLFKQDNPLGQGIQTGTLLNKED